jgi:hypothetical protein
MVEQECIGGVGGGEFVHDPSEEGLNSLHMKGYRLVVMGYRPIANGQ